MARSRESKIELTAYDDLFETDESRAEAALSKIREIPISEIDEFPDHPFKVLMDEDIISPLRQHSQKPSEAREKIVELMGELPRLELFAREKADGWDTWGNEVACDVAINSRPETTGGGLCV